MKKTEILKDKELVIKIIGKFNSFEGMTFEEIALYTNPDFTETEETMYLIPIADNPSYEINFMILKNNNDVKLGSLVFFSNKINDDLSHFYILPNQETMDEYSDEVKHGSNPWILLGFVEEDLKSLPGQPTLDHYVQLYEMTKKKNMKAIAKHYQQKLVDFNGQQFIEVEFSPNLFTMVNYNGEVIKLGPYAYHKKPYRFFELLPIKYVGFQS